MDACQYIREITAELDAVVKEKQLGEVIAQLQLDKNILNALIYPDTPPEKIAKCKSSIEEIATQFEEMEQEAKNITEAMTQFWGSVVQDERLEQLTK